MDDEVARIWALVGELSGQLAANRELVAQLKQESENVKGQVAHVGTGFPLRRFNLDISDEEFQTELEAFSAHLVLENQQLQHENKQLNALLKEYEQTLESVMSKFRGVAHASQQHDLSLHSYYTSLLQTLQTAHSTAHLHDETSLSLLLTRLSTLLRAALRSSGGEEPDADTDLLANLPALLEGNPLSGEPQSALDGQPQAGPSTPPSPTQPSLATASGAGRIPTLQRAPKRPAPFGGSQHGVKGGYSGTEGQGDWAMEREMEILRLEDENKTLRAMLKISEEVAAMDEPSAEGDDESRDADGADAARASAAEQGRRKSSLTLEELEAGAEFDDCARHLRAREIEEKNPSDLLHFHQQQQIQSHPHGLHRSHEIPGGQSQPDVSRFGPADGFETIDMSGSALSEDDEETSKAEGAEGDIATKGYAGPDDEGIENTDEGIIKGGHGLVAPALGEAPDASAEDLAAAALPETEGPPADEEVDLLAA